MKYSNSYGDLINGFIEDELINSCLRETEMTFPYLYRTIAERRMELISRRSR